MKVTMRKGNHLLPTEEIGVTTVDDHQIEFLEGEPRIDEETENKRSCFVENKAVLKKLLGFGILIIVLGLGLSFGVTYGRKHVCTVS
jgi:hypothetical protein